MHGTRPERTLAPTLRRARPDELDALVAVDDDASTLFAEIGLVFALPPGHPYLAHERARWAASLRDGGGVVAEQDGRPIGFSICGVVDGRPYLDQLAVAVAWTRCGVGTALLQRAMAAAGELWLTTWSHVPWNGPWYARHGFVAQADAACGPGLRALLDEQRAVLPRPAQRVAMVWRRGASAHRRAHTA